MAETLEDQTYRIARDNIGDEFIDTFEEAMAADNFHMVCKMVKQVKLETLREATKLHSFACGAEGNLITVIDVEDVLAMIKDIENAPIHS